MQNLTNFSIIFNVSIPETFRNCKVALQPLIQGKVQLPISTCSRPSGHSRTDVSGPYAWCFFAAEAWLHLIAQVMDVEGQETDPLNLALLIEDIYRPRTAAGISMNEPQQKSTKWSNGLLTCCLPFYALARPRKRNRYILTKEMLNTAALLIDEAIFTATVCAFLTCNGTLMNEKL